MAVITVYADYLNIFTNYIPQAKWSLVIISLIMLILVAIVVVEAIRSWIRLSGIPQDYRTEKEVEEDYLKEHPEERKFEDDYYKAHPNL